MRSELRDAGHRIDVRFSDRKTGLTTHVLAKDAHA